MSDFYIARAADGSYALRHAKYIKRERVGDKWRYYYKDDMPKSGSNLKSRAKKNGSSGWNKLANQAQGTIENQKVKNKRNESMNKAASEGVAEKRSVKSTSKGPSGWNKLANKAQGQAANAKAKSSAKKEYVDRFDRPKETKKEYVDRFDRPKSATKVSSEGQTDSRNLKSRAKANGSSGWNKLENQARGQVENAKVKAKRNASADRAASEGIAEKRSAKSMSKGPSGWNKLENQARGQVENKKVAESKERASSEGARDSSKPQKGRKNYSRNVVDGGKIGGGLNKEPVRVDPFEAVDRSGRTNNRRKKNLQLQVQKLNRDDVNKRKKKRR